MAAPLALPSCSGLNNLANLALQSNYLVNSSSLLSRLLPHFPFNRQYSGIGQVSLSQPSLAMVPEQNKVRLGLTANAGLANQLSQQTGLSILNDIAGRSTSGTCQLACGLRFNPADNGIYLKEPVLEELNLQGLASSYTEPARGLINLIGPQILDKYPVHTLEPSFTTRALSSLAVKKNGLLLDFL
ncbi:MAG: hypothetical protein ACSHYB_13565 [Roseibacillus sp.]